MAIKITWDEYEIALLLYVYILLMNQEISKKIAVSYLSVLLKNKAVKKGIIIDEKYRNENGMTMQLSNMNYVVSEFRLGLSSINQDFVTIYNNYRYDYSSFKILVKKSFELCLPLNDKSLNDAVINAFHISEYINDHFEIILSGYCLENNEIRVDDNMLDTELFIDFDGKNNLEYTKPEYISICGDKLYVNSWKDLFMKFVRRLYNTNSTIFTDRIGQNLNSGRRADISTNPEELMRPKLIAEALYIESNLSATDIVRKTKALIDISDFSYSDIIIKYLGNSEKAGIKNSNVNKNNSEKKERKPMKYSKNGANSDFMTWMTDSCGMSEASARSYSSSLNHCNNYAHENNLFSKNIIECISLDEYQVLYDALMDNSDFREYSAAQHNRFTAALKKYYEFLNGDNTAVAINKREENIDEKTIANINHILSERFPEGYRLNNYMHQMKFGNYYEETFNESIGKEESQLDDLIKICGQVVEDRVFASSNDNNLLNDIYNTITSTFDNGAGCMDIECIYNRYASELSEKMKIYNWESLKAYMQSDSSFPFGYSIGKRRITNNGNEPDPVYELRKILSESHIPLTLTEITREIWYITEDRIKSTIRSIDEIVIVDDFTYFYAPNFSISPEEKNSLISAMKRELSVSGYIVKNNLRQIFRDNCPAAAFDSENFKDYAIRNIIGVILADKFEFSDSVITEKGTHMDLCEVYADYVRSYQTLSLAELEEFSGQIGYDIYWNTVLDNVVRVSEDTLVNKDNIEFDIDTIDEYLLSVITNDYIPIREITLFLSFPVCQYKWNGFLLESFIRGYSKKFNLVQLSISKDNINGAIVKKTSSLQAFNDIAADILAKSDYWDNEQSALQHLVDIGMQQRRANKHIGTIIKKARLIKENTK